MKSCGRWSKATFALLAFILAPSVGAGEGDRFVVRAHRDTIRRVCDEHGLRLVRGLGRPDLFLVEAPEGGLADELRSNLEADPEVHELEREGRGRTPRSAAGSALSQSTVVILAGLDRTPVTYGGGTAWAGYLDQPALALIGADRTRADGHTGSGVVVAVIDTGVDGTHPLLRGALVPGHDFTQDAGGAGKDWAEPSQSTVDILQRSNQNGARTKQSTVVILNQSTVVILNHAQAPAATPGGPPATFDPTGPLPASFGHGTMVAGLVRAVAPGARIMPLKAFRDDGSASVSSIVRAIYHAVDKGAKVINMSFDLDRPSQAVRRAVQYATERGVICVGSVGNEGVETFIHPAGLKQVFGVASTTLEDLRAPFSNYGERLVDVAAPGLDLITAFPGGHYAAASGTSFSAGLVSGAVAVLAGAQPGLGYRDANDAFDRSLFISLDMGKGRIDMLAALSGLDLGGGRRNRR